MGCCGKIRKGTDQANHGMTDEVRLTDNDTRLSQVMRIHHNTWTIAVSPELWIFESRQM